MSNTVLKPINQDPCQRIYLVCESSDTGIAACIAQKQEDGQIRPARFYSRKFSHLQMNYGVTKKELFAIVDSVRHYGSVLQGHPITIVTDHQPLTGFLKCVHTNPILIRWHESLSQLDTTIENLEGQKNVIADALSRTYNPIKIPPTRDPCSLPDNRHSLTGQPPIIRNQLAFATPYLHIPRPTITSYTTIPSQTNNRITAGNSTRQYNEDDPEYWEFLAINHQEDDRQRALTSQLQQAARANMQPFATLSAAAVNRLRQATTLAAVATNTSTSGVQSQLQRLAIEELKPRKFLHSIVITNQPSLLNRLPTARPKHILLNQLGAGETSTSRS